VRDSSNADWYESVEGSGTIRFGRENRPERISREILRSGIGFWMAKVRPRSARQDACYDYYDYYDYCHYNDQDYC
jgi:hypothetical protein